MSDRDEKGRFAPGYKGGGRAPRASERRYLELMKEAVTDDDWLKIVRKAVKDAIAGNSWARSWVSDYLVGKPPQILDIRGAEAQQLAEVLALMKAQGVNASEVFNAMLTELAEAKPDEPE